MYKWIYVVTNLSGYIGIFYDITNYVNFESENVIVVRVDATQSKGWLYEGAGIYRHVWLNSFKITHIPKNGVYIHSIVNGNKAAVSI